MNLSYKETTHLYKFLTGCIDQTVVNEMLSIDNEFQKWLYIHRVMNAYMIHVNDQQAAEVLLRVKETINQWLNREVVHHLVPGRLQ